MINSIIISIFEMSKLKLREVKSPGQDQTTRSITVLDAIFALTKQEQKKTNFSTVMECKTRPLLQWLHNRVEHSSRLHRALPQLLCL